MDWTPEIYQSRIDDSAVRRRHAAGSPSGLEIQAYLAACDGLPEHGRVLVLGMTPELRTMAARRFESVVSVDASEVAIGLFADWLPEELRARERLVHGDWCDIPRMDLGGVDVVLGDGIVGNLAGYQDTVELLSQLRGILVPGGRCVMRNVIVPGGLDSGVFESASLLDRFRRGVIDDAEFGFCSRMMGFRDAAYDEVRETLDNAVVYARLDDMRSRGLLEAREWDALQRYRFLGRNYFPREDTWHGILAAAGFGPPRTHPAEKRLWAGFYPVQSFEPVI